MPIKQSKEVRYNLSEEQIIEAQLHLNKLCADHKLDAWSILAKNGDWREIVLRICGLPPLLKEKNRRGRPLNFSKKEKINIAELVDLHRDFPPLDKNGEATKKKVTRYKAYDMVAKKKKISAHKTLDTGKASKPTNVVRGIYNAVEKAFRRREQRNYKKMAKSYRPDEESIFFNKIPNANKKAKN